MTEEQIQFLKELQAQMKYEDEHDYDSQASPRFWVIMDYRVVPAHEDYNAEFTSYFHNDGDHTEFKTLEDLKEFLTEYYFEDTEDNQNTELGILLKAPFTTFDDLWEYAKDELNEDGYFVELPCLKESYIVPDTMFLTKKEAKEYLERCGYNHSHKAHTYAMTAYRSPSMSKLVKLLMTADLDTWERERD